MRRWTSVLIVTLLVSDVLTAVEPVYPGKEWATRGPAGSGDPRVPRALRRMVNVDERIRRNMPERTYGEAVRDALAEEMQRPEARCPRARSARLEE